MEKYGKLIRKIRRNRSITQKYVGNNILSQSAFSKFEAGITDIHSSSFIKIVDRLSISLEELEYINHNYDYPGPQKLIRKFFNLPYNQVDALKELIEEIKDYQTHHSNIDLENIKTICRALIFLEKENDLIKAQSYVAPIWDQLSRNDQWYLTDIRLINVILYFFTNDVAIEMSKKILHRIEDYKEFQNAFKLAITFKINLSLLLIKEKDYHTAFRVLQDTLTTHKKQMSHQSLAICFIRIAICMKALNFSEKKDYLEQASFLLNLYDQQILLKQLMQEYDYFTNTI